MTSYMSYDKSLDKSSANREKRAFNRSIISSKPDGITFKFLFSANFIHCSQYLSDERFFKSSALNYFLNLTVGFQLGLEEVQTKDDDRLGLRTPTDVASNFVVRTNTPLTDTGGQNQQ